MTKHTATDAVSDAEIGALHCLGMCADWAGHPAYEGEEDAGLRSFLTDCANGLRWQRDEIARLRAALRDVERSSLSEDWDHALRNVRAALKATAP